MKEWYVIDTRTNAVINCITTDGPRPDAALAAHRGAEHLRLELHPSDQMLSDYRYWSERP